MHTQYGPGDEITWGACTGHPSDPRTVDQHEDDPLMNEAVEDVCATPALWAQFFADTAADDTMVRTHKLLAEDCRDFTNAQLLVLLLDGTNEQANEARFELQQRFIEAQKHAIDERYEQVREKWAREMADEFGWAR